MSKTGQLQCLMTFFAALVIQNDLLGNSMNETVGVFLVVGNFSVLFVSLYFEVQSFRKMTTDEDETMKEKDEDHEMYRESRVSELLREEGLAEIVSNHEQETQNPLMRVMQGMQMKGSREKDKQPRDIEMVESKSGAADNDNNYNNKSLELEGGDSDNEDDGDEYVDNRQYDDDDDDDDDEEEEEDEEDEEDENLVRANVGNQSTSVANLSSIPEASIDRDIESANDVNDLKGIATFDDMAREAEFSPKIRKSILTADSDDEEEEM